MYSSQVPSLIHNSISVSKLLHIEMSTVYYVLHIIISLLLVGSQKFAEYNVMI